MYVKSLLHKWIKNALPSMHATRLVCLLEVANSILTGGKLSLSMLARNIIGPEKVKNKIKKVDRLLGNKHLQAERIDLYKVMALKAIGNKKKITIVVDWSACANHNNHIIRASLVSKQRSITIYEEVYSKENQGKHSSHNRFLSNLNKILPKGIKVLIVTDAGFHVQWFKAVTKYHWDFLGRVRGGYKYSHDCKKWSDCAELYNKKASMLPKYIGKIFLGQDKRLPCFMYQYKGKAKIGKKYRGSRKRMGSNENNYKKSYKEGWVLVTSLCTAEKTATWVIKQYKSRMQIELEFRTSKSAKWGIGLEYTKTLTLERLQILLLIGAIALFTLWLIGLYAEDKRMHYSYQANTVKSYRVLSLIYLALQILKHEPDIVKNIKMSDCLHLHQEQ